MRTKKYMTIPRCSYTLVKAKYVRPPSFIKKMTVFVADVGEYTLFIKKDMKDMIHSGVAIKTRKSSWFVPKEVIPSSEGSLLYFDKRVGGVFKKNHIYTIQYMKGLSAPKSANLQTVGNSRNLPYLAPDWEQEMIWDVHNTWFIVPLSTRNFSLITPEFTTKD